MFSESYIFNNWNSYIQKYHLLNYILPQHENVDYLVANALAANAYFTESIEGQKAPMLMHKQRHPNLKVISTYITQDVYQHIKNKRILASPTDLMKQQGMIAIDLMIYHLNQKESGKKHKYPFRVGPIVPIIHQDNIKDWSYELLFGRRDYKAVYKLKEKSK